MERRVADGRAAGHATAGAAAPSYVRAPDVLWRESLPGILLLPPGAELPVTLTDSGVDVWLLLAEPRTEERLVAELAGAYAVPADQVRADVIPLLDQLEALHAVRRA